MKHFRTLLLIIVLSLISSSCKKKEEDPTPETTASSLLSEGKSIQEVLNLGYSPFDIYLANPVYLNSLYGKIYSGGYIFHLNTTTGSGLIAGKNDIGEDATWDCCSCRQITEADGDNFGSGKNNTYHINLECYSYKSPAGLSENVGQNWFLPSRTSLEAMYTRLHLKGIGNFVETGNVYISSTHKDNYSQGIYSINFSTGEEKLVGREGNYRVRAVTTFNP